PDTSSYALVLCAELPDATPLSGARFWLAGRELGPTGDDGRATTTLLGRDDDELRVSVLCPNGYRSATEARMLRLQPTRALDASRRPAPLTLALQCIPERARAGLVVRARRGVAPVGVPVLVDDEVVGQTDAHGLAHVLLHGTPHSRVRVQL